MIKLKDDYAIDREERMKTVNGYDSPETVEEQRFTYRGWEIIWERPPIPSSMNCDWYAWRDGYEEEGSLHSSSIPDLKAQIDEWWLDYPCPFCGSDQLTMGLWSLSVECTRCCAGAPLTAWLDRSA
jgi:hypothetical protein